MAFLRKLPLTILIFLLCVLPGCADDNSLGSDAGQDAGLDGKVEDAGPDADDDAGVDAADTSEDGDPGRVDGDGGDSSGDDVVDAGETDDSDALGDAGLAACGEVPHGEEEMRLRYQQAAVAAQTSCVHELQFRICQDGEWGPWSGTFSHETCIREPKKTYLDRDSPGKWFHHPMVARLWRGGGETDAVSYASVGLDPAGYFPIAGDWDGDGIDSVGFLDKTNRRFLLYDELSTSAPTVVSLPAALSTDICSSLPAQNLCDGTEGSLAWPYLSNCLPLAGDWDGSGVDRVGIYDRQTSTFTLLLSYPYDAAHSLEVNFGPANDSWIPVAGDWNHDGVDTVGLYQPDASAFYLRNENAPGPADTQFSFGGCNPNYAPLAGDWDDDGFDEIGLGRTDHNGTFYLRHTLSAGPADETLSAAMPRGVGVPLAGRWGPYLALDSSTPPAPVWVDELILYQMRLDRFTPGETIDAATARLSYLEELGVTGLVLNPVTEYDNQPDEATIGDNAIFYGVLDHASLEPLLGSDADFRTFVQQAHARGIKVILDVVPHGVSPNSALVAQHPEWQLRDWQGVPIVEWGNMREFDLNVQAMREYWVATMLGWIQRFDVDGFRCDLEPGISGSELWREVLERAPAEAGKQIVVISEGRTTQRWFGFHFSQEDFGVNSPFLGGDFVGQGDDLVAALTAVEKTEPYYSNALSSHDRQPKDGYYGADGRLVYFGYGMLLAPVIPFWFMGEEFNAPVNLRGFERLYFNQLDWSAFEEHRSFFEQVKRLIQIRRRYQAVLGPHEPALKDTRIFALAQSGEADLSPYAVVVPPVAIVVVGKKEAPPGEVTVNLPLDELGLAGAGSYRVRELVTDGPAVVAGPTELSSWTVDVPTWGVRALMIRALP